jgi:hypothetical protein
MPLLTIHSPEKKVLPNFPSLYPQDDQYDQTKAFNRSRISFIWHISLLTAPRNFGPSVLPITPPRNNNPSPYFTLISPHRTIGRRSCHRWLNHRPSSGAFGERSHRSMTTMKRTTKIERITYLTGLQIWRNYRNDRSNFKKILKNYDFRRSKSTDYGHQVG